METHRRDADATRQPAEFDSQLLERNHRTLNHELGRHIIEQD